jgi:hypothetical protein
MDATINPSIAPARVRLANLALRGARGVGFVNASLCGSMCFIKVLGVGGVGGIVFLFFSPQMEQASLPEQSSMVWLGI